MRRLIRPVSATILSMPEASPKQPSCGQTGITDQCYFQDMVLRPPQWVWLDRGLTLEQRLIDYQYSKEQPFYAALDFALPEAKRLLCLMAAFLILSAM